ncbi:MAG: RNA polymerase sporulation sigma factor SigK [Firmicutes bacterium]|nr:RNA polymerase sporulation sigma factor SigK [Dethiobacter sp.]MBS3889264.1 RNA polymerase sporulation sigma factor SigK [Bacillota bacterium]MBS4054478.1 RNA polymerase sporulation sigma factor SigK [Thermaerobacter sp.]
MPILALLAKLLGWAGEWQLLVSYVSNNSFPQPLTEEEERTHLKAFKNGGDKRARKILVEHNLRLVAHIVKKYEANRDDVEDLISIGSIGLIKGVDTFDMAKGTKLATYAARCIENEILMYLRGLRRLRHNIYIREPIGIDKEGNEITMLETLASDDVPIPDTVETALQQEKLQELLARLPRRERMVLMLRFGLVDNVRLTQREVAKLLNISRSYVSRIEKKAMQDLLAEVSKEGGF